MTNETEAANPEFDVDDLYLEESFTDRRIGTIRRLTPVKSDGEPDTKRTSIFLGQAQIMTPAGALPLSFELAGETLSEACADFGAAAQKSVEETTAKLDEMRREQASSIYVPGQEQQGAGKIQL
jgi:hypothetical protein